MIFNEELERVGFLDVRFIKEMERKKRILRPFIGTGYYCLSKKVWRILEESGATKEVMDRIKEERRRFLETSIRLMGRFNLSFPVEVTTSVGLLWIYFTRRGDHLVILPRENRAFSEAYRKMRKSS